MSKKTPEQKAKAAAYKREWRLKQIAENPDFREKERDKNNRSRRKRMEDPEYKAKVHAQECARQMEKYRDCPEHRAKILEYNRQWRVQNPEKVKERYDRKRERLESDEDYREEERRKRADMAVRKRLRKIGRLIERDGELILPLWVRIPETMISIVQLDHVIPKQPLRKMGCPEKIVSHIDNTQLLLSGANNTKRCYWLCSDWLIAHAPEGYGEAIALAKRNEERAIAKIREWMPDFVVEMVVSRIQR